MVGPRMRPRFDVASPDTPTDILHRLAQQLHTDDCPFVGSIQGTHARIKVREAERHFWSPQLEIDLQAHGKGTTIHGLFGPSPNVWTLFVALYALLTFAALGGLFFGLSQWMINQTPTALWTIPITLILALVEYFIALTGQKLGESQIQQLRAFLDTTATSAPGNPS